jgi:hypothetical protein
VAPRVSGETTWRRVRQVVRGSVPAVATDPTVTVPAGHVWRVRAVYAELATSAAVANRSPRLVVTDGVATFLSIPPVAVITASLTGRLAWLPGPGAYGAAAGQVNPIPELELQAGWVMSLVTAAIDVADQYTALALIVEDLTILGGGADLADVPDLRVEVVGGPVG